jgi:hypothetical protein
MAFAAPSAANPARIYFARKRPGSGGPRGLQIRRCRGYSGTGGFDSHALPPSTSQSLARASFGRRASAERSSRGARPSQRDCSRDANLLPRRNRLLWIWLRHRRSARPKGLDRPPDPIACAIAPATRVALLGYFAKLCRVARSTKDMRDGRREGAGTASGNARSPPAYPLPPTGSGLIAPSDHRTIARTCETFRVAPPRLGFSPRCFGARREEHESGRRRRGVDRGNRTHWGIARGGV